jgi:hypothetical protein
MPRQVNYRIGLTTPPSARRAAPLVADEIGLHTNVISAATSGRQKPFSSDVGRRWVKKVALDGSAIGLIVGRQFVDEDVYFFRGGRLG